MAQNGKIINGGEESGSELQMGRIGTDEKTNVKMTAEEIQAEKRSIWKNLILIIISDLLIYSPFLALSNVMTSLLDEGAGFTALVVAGVTQPLAAAFLVMYSTKVLGIRKMVSLSMLLALAFNLAFFYPVYGVIVPAGSLVGFIQVVFCSSAFLYGDSLGYWYGKLSDGKLDTILAVMTGAINSSIAGGFLFGNILMYVILNNGAQAGNSTKTTNETFDICGKNYCNEDISYMTTMQPPEKWRYYTMVGVFTGMSLSGIFLSLFLRNFASNLGQTRRKASEFFTMTKDMWMLLKDPRGYLPIVMMVFGGMEEGFVISDFTQAYISCTIGIPNVGLLMFGYGVAQIIISGAQWILARYLGRILTMIFGMSLLMGCLITLSIWTPNPDQIVLLAVISVLWASGDAIVVSTVYSVYGILFEDNVEGSFAVGQVWFALGFLLSFGWSQLLCIRTKLYIMIATAVVGLFLYVILEVSVKRNKKCKMYVTGESNKTNK